MNLDANLMNSDATEMNLDEIPAYRRWGTRSPSAIPQCLQHLTARIIQNGRQGLEIGQTLGYWTLRSTFPQSQSAIHPLVLPFHSIQPIYPIHPIQPIQSLQPLQPLHQINQFYQLLSI